MLENGNGHLKLVLTTAQGHFRGFRPNLIDQSACQDSAGSHRGSKEPYSKREPNSALAP